MPRSTKNNRTLSDSPLLQNENETSVLHSTIHPDRLDMTRFSDRMIEEEEEGSPLRIIIYVVVVIAIGVGLALGVRYLISQNNNQQNTANQQTPEPINNTPVPETKNIVKVNTNQLQDSTVANAPLETDFETTDSVVVGTALTEGSEATLTEINYQPYATFSRLSFIFENLGANNEVPNATWTYNAQTNRMQVTFDALLNLPTEGLNPSNNLNGLVEELRANVANNEFTIIFSGQVMYRVVAVDNAIALDIKETESTQTPDATDEPAETPDTDQPPIENPEPIEEPVVDTPNPTSNKYTNEFSQTMQTISNTKISGNALAYNETFFGDIGPYFEIAFGERYKIGESNIPNAKAEYTTKDGKTYIKLTIQNLSSIEFTGITAADMPQINLENANFVGAKRESFANGTAVILIEVKSKTDFKLLSEPTLSGQTQVISVQIRD